MPKPQLKTLGLAMHGSAARSVFYIGFLEALQKEGIRVDYISAFSGASIVASAYACGTLQELKEEALSLNAKNLSKFLVRSKNSGGWYSLDFFESYFRDKYTLSKKFEDLQTKMSFLATDVDNGDLVELSLGDVARAVRISCSMPGVFEPVIWGSRVLVDGGLVTSVPGKVVRQAGVDVVVGVQIKSNKYFFLKNDQMMERARWYISRFKYLKKIQPKLKKMTNGFMNFQNQDYSEEIKFIESQDKNNLGFFSILARCLDIAAQANKKIEKADPNFDCDLLVSTGTPTTLDSFNVQKGRVLYERGFKLGMKNIPEIKRLLGL